MSPSIKNQSQQPPNILFVFFLKVQVGVQNFLGKEIDDLVEKSYKEVVKQGAEGLTGDEFQAFLICVTIFLSFHQPRPPHKKHHAEKVRTKLIFYHPFFPDNV